MSSGVKNMHVSGCTFIGTDVGLRFKSKRGRGGVVENIFISNVYMKDIPTNAISFNLYYGGVSVSEMMASKEAGETDETIPPVTEETPQFKNINIKNVTCKGAYQAIYLQGLPEMNLENVYLENIHMEAQNGLTCIDAKGVTAKNLKLKTIKTPVLSFYNTADATIEGLQVGNNASEIMTVNGEKTKNIQIKGNSGLELDKNILLGSGVDRSQVLIEKN
jgi:polygalacturonase